MIDKIFDEIVKAISNLFVGHHVDMSYMWDGTLDITENNNG